MAITATLVGSLGGASISSQPVSWDTTSYGSGTTTNVATIPLGASGNWRVLVVVEETNMTTFSTSSSELLVNGATVSRLSPMASSAPGKFGADLSLSGVSSATLAVKNNTGISSYKSVASGTVYWWPET